MPWVRTGDNGRSYPKLLAIAGFPDAPASAVNEAYGFLHGCYEHSAAHVTDYVLNVGAVMSVGAGRWRKLVDWCVRAGLMTPVEREGLPHWVLISDPKFIHIRTEAELDAEQRKRDVSKRPHLAIEVRLRDGDNCRYCGIYVIWDGRKSARSGELDHRDPDAHADLADDLVVACRACNGARQDNRHDWDARNPLRPVPTNPNYGEPTASWLTANGQPTEPNVDHEVLRARGKTSSSKPAAAPKAARRAARSTPHTTDASTDVAAAPKEPAAARKRSAAPRSAAMGTTGTERGTAAEHPAEPPPTPVPNSVPCSIETGSAGSGRVGEKPRKRRRGRRGSGAGPSQDRCCPKPFVRPDPETGVRTCLTCETEET